MPKEDTVFNLKIVEAVEKHPCLYNYKLKEYSNRDKVNVAWEKVAQELGSPVNECKETWRNLRTVFTRNLKKPPSGSGARKKKYYLLDNMQFLVPYVNIKVDTTLPGNLPSPPTIHTEQCEEDEEQDSIVTKNVEDKVINVTHSQNITTYDEIIEAFESASSQQANNLQNKTSITKKSTEPQKKRKKQTDVDECVVKYIRLKTESKESNPRRLFLLSLLPELEEMDSTQFRSFRQQVITTIDNTIASTRPSSRMQASTPSASSWLSSLGQSIRLLLEYTGADYEEKIYDMGPAPDYDSQWYKEKFNLGMVFPNLPYYFDGTNKITQSHAILKHIARKHNLVGKTEEENIKIDMAEYESLDLQLEWAKVVYESKENFEKMKGDYRKHVDSKLKPFSEFLGSDPWFGGENLTYVDFLLYEIFDVNRILFPDCLDNFDNLRHYMTRFESLEPIKKYMSSDRFLKKPLNGPMAAFGGN